MQMEILPPHEQAQPQVTADKIIESEIRETSASGISQENKLYEIQ